MSEPTESDRARQVLDSLRRSRAVRRRRLRLLAAGLTLCGAALLLLLLRRSGEAPPPPVPVRAELRPLAHTLRELGVVVALREKPVISAFTGVVIWKIDEGVFVESGAEILRFDPTQAQDDVERVELEQFSKEEAVRWAKTEIADLERRLEIETRRLKAALELAKLDRDLLVSRPTAEEKRQAEIAVGLAELDFALAESEYRGEEELLALGFTNTASVREKRLAWAGKKANLAKAKILQQLALAGATPDARRQAELRVKEAEINLATGRFNAEANLVVARAGLTLAEVGLKNYLRELAQAQLNLANATVKAPARGRVAFVDVWKGSGILSPVQLGETRSDGQELCRIADTSRLRVRILVNDADLAPLEAALARKDQPPSAVVRLPAFPGRSFRAKVAQVARVAQDKNIALSSLALRHAGEAFVNVCEVLLDFEELSETDREALRLRLTAEVQLDLAPPAPVLALPWTAIRYDAEGRATVREASSGAARIVELGRSDATHVEVRSGLQDGQQVLDFAAGGI